MALATRQQVAVNWSFFHKQVSELFFNHKISVLLLGIYTSKTIQKQYAK